MKKIWAAGLVLLLIVLATACQGPARRFDPHKLCINDARPIIGPVGDDLKMYLLEKPRVFYDPGPECYLVWQDPYDWQVYK